MAFSTTVNDENLARVYGDEKLFEPCERALKPFWTEMEESKDHWPGGAGFYFLIVGATGHAAGTHAEGADWGDARNQVGVQPFITSAPFESPVEVTQKFFDAAKREGALGGDAGHNAIVTATKDLYTHAQRLLACGHGTGRLAVVEAATTANTAFTAKLHEGAWQLRINDPIEFVNTDTGGTVQATAIITDIDYITRRVTTDTSLTLTANWGVYHQGSYGAPHPNGLRSIVDDGDYATSIFGVSRSAPNTYLNGLVMDNSQGLQDYSEELVDDLIDQITMRQDMVPTVLRCNLGVIREHKRIVVADRVYDVGTGGSNAQYPTGANHNQLSYQYGDTKIPFKVDRDLPARELYALHMPSFRRHTLRKAGWIKPEGGGIFQLAVASAGSTYRHAYVANMGMDMNISCRRLNANGKLSYIRDRGLARDSA
jgi:hypothetical protein